MHQLKSNFYASPSQQVLAQVCKAITHAIMFCWLMLKAGLIRCWTKKKQNVKSGFKHSGSNLNLSSHTNLSCKNFDLLHVVWAWNKTSIKNAVGKKRGKKIDWWSYEFRGVEWNCIRIKSSLSWNVQSKFKL